jgi:hypothetical protein
MQMPLQLTALHHCTLHARRAGTRRMLRACGCCSGRAPALPARRARTAVHRYTPPQRRVVLTACDYYWKLVLLWTRSTMMG